MATKMDLSLDDIITQTKGTRRGRGGRGGTGTRGRGSPRRGGRGGGLRTGGPGGRRPANRSSFGRSRGAEGVWSHDKFQESGFGGGRKGVVTARPGAGAKITVSNLHFGVSDADILELFGEIGNIRYASVHYDRSGRSMGKADVVFDRRADAQLAIQQYNGVPLDGRAMAITWANPPPAASPRAGIRQVQGGRVERRGVGGGVRGGFRGGRGGRGRGAGRGGGGKKSTPPTAAELDAELDAYVSQNPK